MTKDESQISNNLDVSPNNIIRQDLVALVQDIFE